MEKVQVFKGGLQKPLAEMGGTPHSPLTESPLSFSGIFFHERTKNYVLVNKVKNGPKWLYKRPKKAKNGVFGPKIPAF